MATTDIRIDPRAVEASAERIAPSVDFPRSRVYAHASAQCRGTCGSGQGVRNSAPARLAGRMRGDQAGEICGRRELEAMAGPIQTRDKRR
jgi:hypothetical protein